MHVRGFFIFSLPEQMTKFPDLADFFIFWREPNNLVCLVESL
mgnify:CR=1 FL=1